jgi:hypothetical protein
MIVFGIFTKFGALFISIPDPIIGGTFFILFGEFSCTPKIPLYFAKMFNSLYSKWDQRNFFYIMRAFRNDCCGGNFQSAIC